jgi:hypothetical protein
MGVLLDCAGGRGKGLRGRGLLVGKIFHAKAQRRKEEGSGGDSEGAESAQSAELTYDRIELSRYAAVVGFRVVMEEVHDTTTQADAGGTAAPQLL